MPAAVKGKLARPVLDEGIVACPAGLFKPCVGLVQTLYVAGVMPVVMNRESLFGQNRLEGTVGGTAGRARRMSRF